MNNYVGFWRRLVAYSVDTFLAGSVLLSLTTVFLSGSTSFQGGGINLISFLLATIYFVFLWAFQDGQTLGNRLLKIKIVNEDGSKLTLGNAILRYFGLLISSAILGIGILWIAFDKRKQGLHDKIAKTLVVSTGNPNILLVVLGFISLGILYSLMMIGFIGKSMNGLGGANLDDRTISNAEAFAFSEANSQRKSKGIPELIVDNHLCAYAQRRLEQLDKLGKYDDGKGFYEDASLPEINKAYFTENPFTGEFSRKVTVLDFREAGLKNIVEQWASISDSNLLNSNFKNGCIRASNNFIVFILGGVRK